MNRRLAWLILLTLLPACAGERGAFIDIRDEAPRRREQRRLNTEAELKDLLKRMETGELPTIQFDHDSDRIAPESYPTLDRMAEIILRDPRLKLVVLAYTSRVGSEKYNLDLSERRARSVKEYLVRRGLPPPSIRFRGMGFSQPIADNATEEGRSRNRRVEFRITRRDWESVY